MRKPTLCLLSLLLSGAACAQALAPARLAPAAGRTASVAEPGSQSWFAVYGRCRDAIRTQKIRNQLDFCKQAVDLALKAGDKTPPDQIALLQSWESYGQALLVIGRGPEALDAENKAVSIAKAHLSETSQEYAMPFYWRALVESHFHDGAAASDDLTTAENVYRKAILASPRMKPLYTEYLMRILRQHATLLDAMGKSTDADKLRAEATQLQARS